MGFHYPLQKIVDLKANERTQAEWILSEAFSQLNELKHDAHKLQQEREHWSMQITEKAVTSTSAAEVQLMQRHLDFLDKQIASKTDEVNEASEQVDRCRQTLGQKMTTEKVWLNAKDKAFNTYKQELVRREQQSVDELVNARFNYQIEAR